MTQITKRPPDGWSAVPPALNVEEKLTKRRIRGAVLTAMGAEAPFQDSKPLQVRDDLLLSEPGQDELLIRIEAASVCHSDLSVVNGDRPRPLPMLLGHESAGVIEEVGPGSEDFAVGQRVAMTFLPRCGECEGCASEGVIPCINGSHANEEGTLLNGGRRLSDTSGNEIKHHVGVSAFATHAVVSKRSVVPVADDVPPEIAAILGCAMLTGGGAVLNVAKLQPQDDVAVMGMGGVGASALLTALALDVNSVTAIDTNDDKLAFARTLGADEALTPDAAEKAGKTYSVVIEAVGHPKAFEAGYRLLGGGGRLVTVGLPRPGSTAEIDPLALTVGNRAVLGSYLGTSVPGRIIPEFEQLWREGRLNLEALITSTIPLDQINEAMDRLTQAQEVRQIITLDTPGVRHDV